jgi:GT2 family glycosyltransferase
MMPAPRITVVIPTYNHAALLARSLDSLAAQEFPPEELEVVVSDDGSTDDTREVTLAYRDRLAVRYHFQEDLGARRATARNAGARLARAPVLAFLDDGLLPCRGWVRAHLEAQRTRCAVMGYCHPLEPELVDGRLDDVWWLPPEQIRERLGTDRRFRDGRHYEFAMVDSDLGRLAVPWWLFWSGNISVRAEDYWRVGGFDEDYQTWGSEDVEFGYRLGRHGLPFVLARDAWAVELPHPPAIDQEATTTANTQALLDKHQAPLVEMAVFVALVGPRVRVERACRALLACARQARAVDVLPELEKATGSLPSGGAPRRVAVFGCGGAAPASWAHDGHAYTLLEFDPDLLGALRGGGHQTRYAIGLRTGLPDAAFDLVVITSRLRELWRPLGGYLLDEARRIGREVHIAEGLRAETAGADLVPGRSGWAVSNH